MHRCIGIALIPALFATLSSFAATDTKLRHDSSGCRPTAPVVAGSRSSTNTRAAAEGDQVPPEASIRNSALQPSSQPNSDTLSADAPRMKPKRPMLIEN